MFQDVRPLSLSTLLLDFENPRHDIVTSQRDAIRTMIDNQKEKLLRLAEDIIQAGINPSELLIVIPYEKNNDFYIVLEGNRRLTTLKLLETPSLIPDKYPKAIRTGFSKLSSEYSKNPITEIYCAVMPDRDAANRWIRLKHTGENLGIGTVGWGANEIARFNERFGTKAPSLQVIDFVKRYANLDQTIEDKLNKIPITNLTRLLNDPSIRQLLGVDIVDGKVSTQLLKEEVLKGLIRIIDDLANKKINVNDIYTKKDRSKYIETFEKSQIPDASKKASQTWNLESESEPPGPATPKAAEKKIKRSKPINPKRKSLIPTNCVIKIEDARINRIYAELKRINVDDFPNSGAILLRVFFELSIDKYIDKKNLSTISDAKLKKKVAAIIKEFQSAKIMNKNELKSINSAISNPNTLFSIDTLHSYVHNRLFHPKPTELKNIWDEMQLFMEKLWE